MSVGWDAALERICTYALLENMKKEIKQVFYIRFDHVGNIAREQSAKLLLEKIQNVKRS